jgi:UDPglucose--hexose-1-phosphate uridylyltransferase
LQELRKDYFLDRLTIVSPSRAGRPHLSADEEEKVCPFCPGNEELTPLADLVLVHREGTLVKMSDSEAERVKDWVVRVFPNKYPAVSPKATGGYSDTPLYSEPAHGYHYVAVATPNHNEAFGDIDVEQWVNVLATVQEKVKWFYTKKRVAYVSVFINYGEIAGASIDHPHLQMVTLPRLPPIVEREAQAVQRALDTQGVCPMCSIVGLETGGPRQIIATEHYVAFAPWSPSHDYEFWIYPRRHQTSFLRISQAELSDLALILRATLGGLARAVGNPAFNLVFHNSSEKKTTKQLHWHIEVYPHTGRWGGLEWGSGVYISQVSPEQAAQILGAGARKELASLVGVT